jgi:hypothetical protein
VIPEGVLVESTPDASWAWIGIRLAPAPTLAESRAYADVAEPQRRIESSAGEQAWLAGQWSTMHGVRWELRYTNDLESKLVSCTLLGRVHDRDAQIAAAAAVSLRDRLTDTPRHIRSDPILDVREVSRRLAPTPLDAQGCFEIRKRLSWARCSRRETKRQVCFAVSPLAADGRSWEPLWHELARLPRATVVSVYLEPYAPSVGLTAGIAQLAQEYAYLAGPGPVNPVWSTVAPPDQFAVAAASLYAEATRRYATRAYRIRVSIVSQGPVPWAFSELVAASVGGAVVRQPPPAELDASWRNLAALNRDWLDETYRQGAPAGCLTETERILCDLVDLPEATAAFRMPYEVPGHLPLFTTADRPSRSRGN